MKKKNLIIIFTVVIFIFGVFVDKLLFTNNDIDDGINEPSSVNHKHMLSMMLEQNAGAGDYSLETRSSWPTKEDGYIFNSTLSKCEKGSKLRWDDENNVVIMTGNVSDKCYVYFDLVPPVTLSDLVKGQYIAQGVNNLYYHDSTLENGAGDNSYRYAGASETTNNFVCFGSDAKICPDDNLYRIIGIFGDQVKLIKWDYPTSALLGTDGDYCNTYLGASKNGTSKGTNSTTDIGVYYWNYTNRLVAYSATNYYNVWSYSKLNTVNLNTNFLNNIGTEWANKIAETTWEIGGNTYENIVMSNAQMAYTNEITNPDATIESTYKAKVALMYVSDYYYAASPTYWTYPGFSSSGASYDYRAATGKNWMYMGLYEWTVVRTSDGTNAGFYLISSGYVSFTGVNNYEVAVRPVFYLNSDVEYDSGTGTKTDPYRIKLD